MKEQVKKVLSSKNFVYSNYLVKVALEHNLSLNEFLVLVYLENSFSNSFEIELISSSIGIDVNTTMEAFNSLMIKGLVTLDSVKDVESRFNEVINIEPLYNLISENLDKSLKKEVKDDIFKVFEREFGRTLSSMELELINGWLISGTPEELVLGALREAVYNGVSNFRYIDKIIYEWEKKGFKTMDEVNSYIRNRREENHKDKVISKKEQDILDYDWLDS